MQRWSEALTPHSVAQVLLTQSDIDDPTRFFNARRALEALERAAIIPIGNENDTVATEEIKIGDNDTLAAHIAKVVSADLLIVLTQVDGLYTANPEEDHNAQKISVVYPHDEVWDFASDSSQDGWGRGGMKTKLKAAEIAGQAGIPTIVAHGSTPLPDLLTDPQLGTLFLPPRSSSEALRDRWPVCGEVWVNEVGSTAIFSQQPLELTHIQHVLGQFSRGDLIELCSKEYGPIGRSLVAYGDQELKHAIQHGHDQLTPESIMGDSFDGPVCTPRDWALTYTR
jgi:glutamate 5-kinase